MPEVDKLIRLEDAISRIESLSNENMHPDSAVTARLSECMTYQDWVQQHKVEATQGKHSTNGTLKVEIDGIIFKITSRNTYMVTKGFGGPDWKVNQEPFLCKDCGNVMSAPVDERTNIILPKYSHCDKCNSTNFIPGTANIPNADQLKSMTRLWGCGIES